MDRTPKSHLAYEERCQIYAFLSISMSPAAIARKLGVHRSTVSREIRRNSDEKGYYEKQAQEFADQRRTKASSIPRVLTPHVINLVHEMLRKTHASPEQIAGRLKLEKKINISPQTIYALIFKDRLNKGFLFTYLRRKGKKLNYKKGKVAGRGVIPNRTDISQRPSVVDLKQRFGDFEVDTIVGAHHKGAIVSVVDKATKVTMLGLVSTGTAALVSDILIKRCNELISKGLPVHTITSDNGKEFSDHELVAKNTGAAFFFARPYTSNDRGLNEHTNGLVREFLPKKTDFTKVTHEEVARIEWILNNRPRKSLDYKTPAEVVNSLLLLESGLVAFRT
jgi:IS30 family transposase